MKNIFLIVLVAYVYSKPSLDTYICQRSNQYQSKQFETFAICSPYRTGSTVVTNIVNYLFGNAEQKIIFGELINPSRATVYKFHSFLDRETLEKKKCLQIITVRNPLDILHSFARLKGFPPTARLKKEIDDVIRFFQEIQKVTKSDNKNTLLVKYESFANSHFDALLSQIATKTKISILERDRKIINTLFTKQSVDTYIKQVKKYDSFGQIDEATQFHGEHIDTNEVHISKRKKAKMLQAFRYKLASHRALFSYFGYKI